MSLKRHQELSAQEVRAAIHQGAIQLAGNCKLKIYGKLNCKSGKRMKNHNRIFFANEKEALEAGYRPCGHCLKLKFLSWKENKFKID